MGRIILILLLSVAMLFVLVSCGDDGETTGSTVTTGTEAPPTIIDVAGKVYKADITTVNVAWDEGDEEPSQYKQETFVALLKTIYANSVIEFTSETSFTLKGTKDGLWDIVAEDCDRMYNELFQSITKFGNVDVVVEDGTVSFLSDCFVDKEGWGMYFSIDYTLQE